VLKYDRLARSGELASSRDVPNPVLLGLADEEGFPHRGQMDFVDNQLDPRTGTMRGRAVFPNPDLALTPGLFARVRLLGSGRHQALLLPDESIGTDQSDRFVLVVDGQGRVESRIVEPGPLIEGFRVVRNGLAPEDQVVIGGIQAVQPGSTVAPRLVEIAAPARFESVEALVPSAPANGTGG
jgi:multidrug efflux system membrane fusion protein